MAQQEPASPNEKSVVIAIRDWQWRRGIAGKRSPDFNLQLAGTSERPLGDGIVMMGERLFLLEVKSTREHFRFETQSIAKTLRPKAAYKTLCSSLDEITHYHQSGHLLTDPVNKTLVQSLVAHHFAFWQEGSRSPNSQPLVCPYLIGLHEQGLVAPRCTNSGEKILNQFDLAASTSDPDLADHESIECSLLDAANMDMIDTKVARIVAKSSAIDRDYDWQHLGLELDAFQDYINTLCDGKDIPLYAVIMSSAGSVFDIAGSTGAIQNIVQAYETATPLNMSPMQKGAKIFRAKSVYPRVQAAPSVPDPA